MGQSPHIVILGAGLIGLSCADSLLAAGCSVTIIEQKAEIGLGAARYNSAMIHPSQSMPWLGKEQGHLSAKVVLDLARTSMRLVQKRRAELKCRDISRPAGTLQLFDSIHEGEKNLETLRGIGVDVRSDYQGWNFLRYSLYFQEDQSGDASQYSHLLAKNILSRGGQILLGNNAKLSLSSEKCQGITISGEFMMADHVIIACGAQSAAFAKAYDIDLPVTGIEGHALCFDLPKNVKLPDIPIMHWDSRSALTIFENHVRISGTIGKEHPDVLREIWSDIAPDIVNGLGPPIVRWSADRPVSRLGRPIISQSPVSNLWVNTGHGHMGWSLCTASGALMADMILKGIAAPEFSIPG